jgi:MFS family permease
MNSVPDATEEPPHRQRTPWLATRLSVQMFLAFAVQGAWVPAFSVFLARRGFSPEEMAWTFTAYSLSSLVAPLAWGQVADRWVPAERCISLCALIVALTLGAMPFLGGAQTMFPACVVFWFFMIPVNSLGTALTLRQLDHPERGFGRVRLWGTIGWACAGLLVTFWLRVLKPALLATAGEVDLSDSFWIGALFAAALSGYTLTLPTSLPSPRDSTAVGLHRLLDAPLLAIRLFRRRAFLIYCFCLFGAYLTYPFVQQLTPLLLAQLGVNRDVLPMTLTVAQSTEVATLAVLPWFLARFGTRGTMAVGLGAWTVGLGAFAVGQPVSLVVSAMTTQGLFIGCFLVAGQVFVNRQSAPDVRASAQGLMVLIGGVGLLAGHLLVGQVRNLTQDNFGLAFVPPACASAVLVVVFLTAFTTRRVPGPGPNSLVSGQEMT